MPKLWKAVASVADAVLFTMYQRESLNSWTTRYLKPNRVITEAPTDLLRMPKQGKGQSQIINR